jgi:hypothetical protein
VKEPPALPPLPIAPGGPVQPGQPQSNPLNRFDWNNQ